MSIRRSSNTLFLLILLAGCGEDKPQPGTVRQTGFPGQISAGGSSSGEIMSRKPNTVAGMPAGTPGIPGGSGGNVAGASLGATAQGESTAGGSAGPTAAQAGQPATAPPREGRGEVAPDASTATSKPNIGVADTPDKGQQNAPEIRK